MLEHHGVRARSALFGRSVHEADDEELSALPAPGGHPGTLLDAIDLIVPHQANQTMVVTLAQAAGIAPERLYFNIAHVGNTSAASVPLALYDAVREGVINRPLRVFAPGFGAGAVAGYAILKVDPTIVAPEPSPERSGPVTPVVRGTTSEDARVAFAG